MHISIMHGVEHVSIRLDKCYIHSGNLTNFSLTWSTATGLSCVVNFVNEHANGNTMPVHISSTKFVSNYGGAMVFIFGSRSSCICNSSAYQVLIDSCEFSNNMVQIIGSTGITAMMMSDKGNTRVTVQETVLKVRLVIRNSTFHHNCKSQTVSPQNVDLIQFHQLPEVEIINSTFLSNTGSRTIIISKSSFVAR